MDFNFTAEQILKAVGGNENIVSIMNCLTRVRVEVKDTTLVDVAAVKKLEGVQGTNFSRKQFQIIMGGKCSDTFDALNKIVKVSDTKAEIKFEKQSILNIVVDYVTGTFQPVIPVLVGAGIIQGVIALLNYTGVDQTSFTYQFLNIFGNTGYYFLPIFLAFSAGRKLNINPYLAAFVGAVLVHPNLLAIVSAGGNVDIFGVPVKLVNYASSITPIIVSMPLVYWVEKFAKKISPDILKSVLVPAITILVVMPVVLVVTGPAATIISTFIGYGINYIYTNFSVLGGLTIGGGAPFLVLTGLHQAAALPILIDELTRFGYTMFFPILGFGNAAIAGAALGVVFRTKNKALKSTALSATTIGAIGITEPALYGVLLPTKRPFIAVGIMSAVCGALSLVFQVKAYGLGLCGLGGLPVFFGSTFVVWCVLMLVSYFGSAAITYVLNFTDVPEAA